MLRSESRAALSRVLRRTNDSFLRIAMEFVVYIWCHESRLTGLDPRQTEGKKKAS